MDIYIARQPIFNRHKRLFAYEVLYRSGMDNAFPAEVDSDEATHTVLAHVLFNIGLETITGGRRALINFTENHLLQRTPTQLPQSHCIIEILESILPTPEILEVCQELKQQGYVLALDDFDFNPLAEQLIPYVDIVKVDIQAVEREQLVAHMARMRQYPAIEWLAEKIENYEEFNLALSLGFSYFQGYFFNRPEVLKNRKIDTSKIVLLNLLAEVCRPEIDMNKIERLVAPDVSLSYKLLRYINSVFYSLVNKVTSIRYALIYLGESGTRQFISLAAASEISEGKPSELMRLSMVRAELCQLLAAFHRDRVDPSQLFLLGLFSLLDAMLDMPMAELTDKLPLSPEVKAALNDRQGPLAPYLSAVIAYEKGEFDDCTASLRQLEISPDAMINAYFKALSWADLFDASLS
jgi:EAL and modified HD-GYP domain-containing signal transduction protein